VFHPSEHDVEMTEDEFRLLRDFIHEQFGLYFEDGQRGSLRSRVSRRLLSLDLPSFKDYYNHLRFGPDRAEEMRRLASHLTNNETYFFRESSQLKVLGERILRSLKDSKASGDRRSIRLLSVGCSTGEEPYTLAMIVYDSGQFFWGWDVQIAGLDVDEAALEKARRGLYFSNSFRGVSPALVERHFVRQGVGAQLKDSIRRLVTFREGNLLDPASYAGLKPVDVVLCRNVLIYFSETMVLRAVRLFHDVLLPGGYLLLGHAESLSRLTDLFTPIRFQGAMIYQKPGG
jgi:chemotaxis protein methyltransferase CheR